MSHILLSHTVLKHTDRQTLWNHGCSFSNKVDGTTQSTKVERSIIPNRTHTKQIDMQLRDPCPALMALTEKRKNISHQKLFVIDLVSCLWLEQHRDTIILLRATEGG